MQYLLNQSEQYLFLQKQKLLNVQHFLQSCIFIKAMKARVSFDLGKINHKTLIPNKGVISKKTTHTFIMRQGTKTPWTTARFINLSTFHKVQKGHTSSSLKPLKGEFQ